MKIARVEPFHVEWGAGRNRSAWVRIWTGDGAYGLGEASPMVHGSASLEIIEEPVQHYHVESFAKVAAALDIAVSAGEQEYTLQGIKRLIEAGVDIVQPDIVKTGGFTGLGDMAALARAYGVDFVPHQTQPSIGHTANLHFVASLTHSHHPAEYNGPYQVQDVVFRTPVRLVKGKFVLSDAPGLGLELDEAELTKRTIPWTSSAPGAR
ncbi:MAG: hypothetical protein DMD87_02120 [Candidatus Rokuibacteriota bacterium]|nr:MAG: hypothetical protein DMD87_02120 [Candidatus Rokubacteria bacterium]